KLPFCPGFCLTFVLMVEIIEVGFQDASAFSESLDVILPSLFGVTQNFIRLLHILEPFLKKRIPFVLIRVKFGSVRAIRFPDVIKRSVPLKAEYLVVVFDFTFHFWFGWF